MLEHVDYRQVGYVATNSDPDSAAWWQHLARGEFVLPMCRICGRFSFPPGPRCPFCASAELALSAAPVDGQIYSWIVVHRALHPAFDADVPYTIVAVTMNCGPRIFGRLIDGDPAAGLPVEAITYQGGPQRLLGFKKRTS
jgi:uncharacterized OB-fold protein